MTAPYVERLTVQDAKRELNKLERSVEGGINAFERRAYLYELSPREQGVWERISELRWLVSDE